MAKQRDYKREYELSKQRGERDKVKNFTIAIPIETFQDFKAKTELEGTRPGTLIRKWIESYLYD
mgnify:CR=1 FL=1